MKKIFLFATIVALSFAVMPANAQSRKDKKAAQKEAWDQEQQRKREEEQRKREEAELEHQLKMEKMREEQQRDREKKQMEYDAEKRQWESEAAISNIKLENARKATALILEQKIYMPCIEKSYDEPGKYMAGLGIAEGEIERGAGMINANRTAVAEITSKYIGMIKNGVSQYAKNVNTRTGNKVKGNELEGAAEAIGTKLIDKYANAVCRDFGLADDGTYTCYVAVQVPLKDIVNATVDEFGVIQTDLDRQKFREYMQSELDKQAEAVQAEKQEILKMRQERGL